jgi:hypothetical protein
LPQPFREFGEVGELAEMDARLEQGMVVRRQVDFDREMIGADPKSPSSSLLDG